MYTTLYLSGKPMPIAECEQLAAMRAANDNNSLFAA